jgi:hypothetical protein
MQPSTPRIRRGQQLMAAAGSKDFESDTQRTRQYHMLDSTTEDCALQFFYDRSNCECIDVHSKFFRLLSRQT